MLRDEGRGLNQLDCDIIKRLDFAFGDLPVGSGCGDVTLHFLQKHSGYNWHVEGGLSVIDVPC